MHLRGQPVCLWPFLHGMRERRLQLPAAFQRGKDTRCLWGIQETKGPGKELPGGIPGTGKEKRAGQKGMGRKKGVA